MLEAERRMTVFVHGLYCSELPWRIGYFDVRVEHE